MWEDGGGDSASYPILTIDHSGSADGLVRTESGARRVFAKELSVLRTLLRRGRLMV